MMRIRTEPINAANQVNVKEVINLLNSPINYSQQELDFAVEAAICSYRAECAEIVRILLSHGANISASALQAAVRFKNVEVFQAFFDYGWDVNAYDNRGQYPLKLIVRDIDCVRWFLDNGADPNARSRVSPTRSVWYHTRSWEGFTALAVAATNFETDVPILLITRGADLDPEALYSAISTRGKKHSEGALRMMKCLLDHGMDVNAPSEKYGSPLNFAIRKGNKERVQLLLDYGADRDFVFDQKTPAEHAKERGKPEMYDLFFQVKDGNGASPKDFLQGISS